jgi:hypothetical protein
MLTPQSLQEPVSFSGELGWQNWRAAGQKYFPAAANLASSTDTTTTNIWRKTVHVRFD